MARHRRQAPSSPRNAPRPAGPGCRHAQALQAEIALVQQCQGRQGAAQPPQGQRYRPRQAGTPQPVPQAGAQKRPRTKASPPPTSLTTRISSRRFRWQSNGVADHQQHTRPVSAQCRAARWDKPTRALRRCTHSMSSTARSTPASSRSACCSAPARSASAAVCGRHEHQVGQGLSSRFRSTSQPGSCWNSSRLSRLTGRSAHPAAAPPGRSSSAASSETSARRNSEIWPVVPANAHGARVVQGDAEAHRQRQAMPITSQVIRLERVRSRRPGCRRRSVGGGTARTSASTAAGLALARSAGHLLGSRLGNQAALTQGRPVVQPGNQRQVVAGDKYRDPTWLNCSNSCMISAESAGSRLPVGSSASNRLGLFTTARAMPTRCCSPPDRVMACLFPGQQADLVQGGSHPAAGFPVGVAACAGAAPRCQRHCGRTALVVLEYDADLPARRWGSSTCRAS